jgi:hypothetical protein
MQAGRARGQRDFSQVTCGANDYFAIEVLEVAKRGGQCDLQTENGLQTQICRTRFAIPQFANSELC